MDFRESVREILRTIGQRSCSQMKFSAAESAGREVANQSEVVWRQQLTNGKTALAHWIGEVETGFCKM